MENKENEKQENNEELNENQEEQVSEKANTEEADMADELIKLNNDLQKYKNTIVEIEKEKNQLKEQVLRKAAEFENFKKRKENEIENLLKYAAESYIVKTLNVFNDLERSLTHAGDESNLESLKKGIELVHTNFKKVLEEQGVTKIKAEGEPFDFNIHEALMPQVSAEHEPNTVLQEIEPGYMYHDKVIKHSKVIVSMAPPEAEESAAESNEK